MRPEWDLRGVVGHQTLLGMQLCGQSRLAQGPEEAQGAQVPVQESGVAGLAAWWVVLTGEGVGGSAFTPLGFPAQCREVTPGAWHGAEKNMLWGLEALGSSPSTASLVSFSSLLLCTWVSLSRKQDPDFCFFCASELI